jgi:hypothetical protein
MALQAQTMASPATFSFNQVQSSQWTGHSIASPAHRQTSTRSDWTTERPAHSEASPRPAQHTARPGHCESITQPAQPTRPPHGQPRPRPDFQKPAQCRTVQNRPGLVRDSKWPTQCQPGPCTSHGQRSPRTAQIMAHLANFQPCPRSAQAMGSPIHGQPSPRQEQHTARRAQVKPKPMQA